MNTKLEITGNTTYGAIEENIKSEMSFDFVITAIMEVLERNAMILIAVFVFVILLLISFCGLYTKIKQDDELTKRMSNAIVFIYNMIFSYFYAFTIGVTMVLLSDRFFFLFDKEKNVLKNDIDKVRLDFFDFFLYGAFSFALIYFICEVLAYLEKKDSINNTEYYDKGTRDIFKAIAVSLIVFLFISGSSCPKGIIVYIIMCIVFALLITIYTEICIYDRGRIVPIEEQKKQREKEREDV